MTLTLKDPSQPFYVEGYHKPAGTAPDEPAYDALADILTRGNTSRLYRTLVQNKKIAVAVQGGAGFPGVKYPNLWILVGVPARGIANDTVRDAMREEVAKIQKEEVTDEELQRFKTRAKADLLRSLNSNTGLAEQFSLYQTLFGDWRELFRYVERVDKVTKADVKRVAGDAVRRIQSHGGAHRNAVGGSRAEARLEPGGEAMTRTTFTLTTSFTTFRSFRAGFVGIGCRRPPPRRCSPSACPRPPPRR